MKKFILVSLLYTFLLSTEITAAPEALPISFISEEATLDEFLHHHFQVIDTNIEGYSLDEKFHQAKVILLLETHKRGGGQISNSQLINRQWNQGDQLLTEGLQTLEDQGAPSTVALLTNPEIFTQHGTWDDEEAIGEEIFNTVTNLATLIGHSSNTLLHLCLSSLGKEESAVDEDFNELVGSILNFYANDEKKIPSPKSSEWTPNEKFEYLLSLLPILAQHLETTGEALEKDIISSFFARNQSMVQKIFENLEKYNRVWLIAGAAHGQYTDKEFKESVALVYNSLKEKNIPYITLRARKTPGVVTTRELEGKSLNDPDDSEWILPELEQEFHERLILELDTFKAETQDFKNDHEWRVWMSQTLMKRLNRMQEENDDALMNLLSMSGFLDFCFEKIINEDVLRHPLLQPAN